jgi:tetratricopeptide (TPR) repeat protein
MEVLVHPTTLDNQENWHQFAQQLQEFLRSLPQAALFQVECVVKRGNLMVLSQHPPDQKPDPQEVFEALEQAIQVFIPGFVEGGVDFTAVPPGAQAKLYLRELGQKHPYAFHVFKLSLAELDESESFLETAELSGDCSEPLEDFLPQDKQLGEVLPQDSDRFDLDQLLVLEPEPEEVPLTPDNPELKETVSETEEFGRSQRILWIVAGVGVSVVSFIGGILIFSRPCVVGQCEPVQMAEALSQEANQLTQKAQSGQDLRQAQQKLNEANQLLSKIPLWSKRHEEAQTLLQKDQSQMSQLDLVLAVESKANEAIQKGQTIPRSAAEWQGIQEIWKDAIAQLESVPEGTELHSFAQRQLITYRSNLSTINQYITDEQQAQKKLEAAKSTANVAQARQGVAQSIENWQQVQVTWQVAVNALRQIPNTTTSFVAAQELLGDYTAKLAIARDRATREQFAQNSYSQAVALGQKAESLQRQNQWTQAVANWRIALKQIEQIPEGTATYNQAQQLIAPYNTSLQQAEAQLKVAVSQQKLRTDLNQVCSGSPKICSYVILSNMIRVQFTPAYEIALKQAFAAGRSGNYGMLGGAVNHVDTLQSALQSISNNSGLPIEVYNADGTEILGSFNPTS